MSPTRSAKRDSAKRQLKAQHQEVEHSAQCESGHYCRTANWRGKLLNECSGGWRIPLLGQEGWTRPQENAAKRPYERSGRGGPSCRTFRKCISKHSSRNDHPVCAFNWWPPATSLDGAATPPVRRRGIRYPTSGFSVITMAREVL